MRGPVRDSDRERWEARYAPEEYICGKEPVPFLAEKLEILPRGRALCLAAGEGRNAVFLAQQGWQVTAVDISDRAVEKCTALARERGVTVEAHRADLLEWDLGEERYDLVTNFFFCERAIFPRVMRALKPEGMFVLQTYSIDQQRTGQGARDPAYLLRPNELLEHFRDYRIRYYEDALIPVEKDGECRPRAIIRLMVQKRSPEGAAPPAQIR